MSIPSSPRNWPTFDDALAYVKTVEERFQDNMDIYVEFLDVTSKFRVGRIDTLSVIQRVKELLKDHPDLLLAFNTFLPNELKITFPLEVEEPFPKKPAKFQDAFALVIKVKNRFKGGGNDHVYKDFLNILSMYRKGTKSAVELYQKVSALLHGHDDLLSDFAYFLPGGDDRVNVPEEEDVGGIKEEIAFATKIKNRFEDGNYHVHEAFTNILMKYRNGSISVEEVHQEVSVLFRGHVDLIADFTKLLPPDEGGYWNISSEYTSRLWPCIYPLW